MMQRRFNGYLNTPLLWKNADIFDLQNYELEIPVVEYSSYKAKEHLRLGKLVERFVLHQLAHDPRYNVIAENIQIQDDKRTIGELDVLLLHQNTPIHLEIIFKFYLYDPNENGTSLSHWIGPNRKDRLLHKLNKLKEKQLPLLYHPKTKSFLQELDFEISSIKQHVLFKAQLFLPLNHENTVFSNLNPASVKGFYLKIEELERFQNGQFYIPQKIDWLMDVHEDVAWMGYSEFLVAVNVWIDKKLAPMCWLKDDGYFKFFVVWW